MAERRGIVPPAAPAPYSSFLKKESLDLDDSSYYDMSLPPRPGTASEKSKSFTSTKPRLSNFSNLSFQTPDIDSTTAITANAVLQRVVNRDSLLRILDEANAFKSNEIIMMSEVGDLAGITNLINNGVSVDFLSSRGLAGYTPLHHACNRGHSAIVSILLRNHQSIINLRNDAGESALHMAVYGGNMNIVEQLLDHNADIDAVNEYNETPLFYAARKSMPALVRLLLQRGSNIEVLDRFGEKAEEHSSDSHTLLAFKTQMIDQNGMLPLNELLLVFQYLEAKDICRCAMVAGKWHRVSETESIWMNLGVRR